jgi:imidazolonepropionase
MKILIKNIKGLVMVFNSYKEKLSGVEMNNIPVLEQSWLAIENYKIAGFGLMEDWDGISDWRDLTVIDAEGKFVFPSWCDSHTHIVYAGSREREFVDRIHGLTYEEIAKRGGGILNSAQILRRTSEEELLLKAFERLEEIKWMGTGAVEIKSGYGLSLESELKMLRVIKKLKEISPLTIKANLLAAHAMPTEFKENRNDYIDIIINEIIPAVAEEKLADYIDVFCDKGFFTPLETENILIAGLKYGLVGKIHANELDFSGGIQIGVANKALSVDHLQFTGEKEIELLKSSQTMPTLLPTTAFFLKLNYPPARRMIDSGLAVALASDYNPGSSPSGKMTFVQSLGCLYMEMTPEETIAASTLNSAYAMGVNNTLGSIEVGKTANIFITKEIPSISYLAYSFGSDLIETVIINGTIQIKEYK